MKNFFKSVVGLMLETHHVKLKFYTRLNYSAFYLRVIKKSSFEFLLSKQIKLLLLSYLLCVKLKLANLRGQKAVLVMSIKFASNKFESSMAASTWMDKE